MKPLRPLIDADVVAYASAALTDGKKYRVNVGHFTHNSKYKKDMNAVCDAQGIDKKLIETYYEPEDVGHAIHTMKLRLNKVVKALNTVPELCELYLSSPINFRYDVDPDYKANRKGNRVPANLGSCKSYLEDYWDARTIENYEADDVLGMVQTMHFIDDQNKSDTCICTIDKDLDMIPGWHYNWMHDKKYWITPDRALRIFYEQLLKGDKVDNIIGLKGIGDVRSKRLIDTCTDEEEMYHVCLAHYHKEEPTLGKAEERMLKNANLLWILQQKDAVFTDRLEVLKNKGGS